MIHWSPLPIFCLCTCSCLMQVLPAPDDCYYCDFPLSLLNCAPLFGQKMHWGLSSQDLSNHIRHGSITPRKAAPLWAWLSAVFAAVNTQTGDTYRRLLWATDISSHLLHAEGPWTLSINLPRAETIWPLRSPTWHEHQSPASRLIGPRDWGLHWGLLPP